MDLLHKANYLLESKQDILHNIINLHSVTTIDVINILVYNGLLGIVGIQVGLIAEFSNATIAILIGAIMSLLWIWVAILCKPFLKRSLYR